MKPMRFFSPSKHQRGFSLVELMVSLVLGLLVIGGIIGVFLSHRALYRQNENLARMQESARYAFELMARSLREAGGMVCGSNIPIVNVLKTPADIDEGERWCKNNWWARWSHAVCAQLNYPTDAILGYEGDNKSFPKAFGTGKTDRAEGTDAVIVWSGTLTQELGIKDHTQLEPSKAQFQVFNANPEIKGGDIEIKEGDILLVCNTNRRQAAIFQATPKDPYDPDDDDESIIVYDTSDSVSPGNCSVNLNLFHAPCSDTFVNYSNNNNSNNKGLGYIAKLTAYAWYIGHNSRGGRSLYRLKLQNNSRKAGSTAEEVAEGVSDLQIQYLTHDTDGNLATDYVDATSVTDWTKVVAVRLTFTLESLENVAVGTSQPLRRTWNTVVTLRNRAL